MSTTHGISKQVLTNKGSTCTFTRIILTRRRHFLLKKSEIYSGWYMFTSHTGTYIMVNSTHDSNRIKNKSTNQCWNSVMYKFISGKIFSFIKNNLMFVTSMCDLSLSPRVASGPEEWFLLNNTAIHQHVCRKWISSWHARKANGSGISSVIERPSLLAWKIHHYVWEYRWQFKCFN